MVKKIYVLVFAVFLLVLLPTFIQAQVESYMINYTEFRPYRTGSTSHLSYYYTDVFPPWYYDGWMYVPSGSYSVHFYAPFRIPDGHRVTGIELFCKDYSTSNVTLYVYRKNMYNGLVQEMGKVSTIDSSESWRIFSRLGLATRINNQGYGYFVKILLPAYVSYSDHIYLAGVKIKHTLN